MSYTVEWRGDVQQDGHRNISYFMRLQGVEGGVLIRHASSDRQGNLILPFKAGDVIEGWELHQKVGRNDKPYWKLERIKQQQPQWNVAGATSTTTNGAPVAATAPSYEDADPGLPPARPDPPVNPEQARQRAIAAQASQKVAVDVVRLGLSSLGQPDGSAASVTDLTRHVLKVAEMLFDQVEGLSKRA